MKSMLLEQMVSHSVWCYQKGAINLPSTPGQPHLQVVNKNNTHSGEFVQKLLNSIVAQIFNEAFVFL